MESKIKDIMNYNVISIKPEMPFTQACTLFSNLHFHHLPVTKENKLIGIFTTTDAILAVSRMLAHHKINSATDVNNIISITEVMTSTKIITLSPNDDLETAVNIFQKEHIHSVPIVQEGKLVGIITSTDILNKFRESVT